MANTPFKMKGWSGNQNPSPVKKDWKEAVQEFKDVAQDLSQHLKDIGSGKMARKIKSDIQGLQKEISQKLGKKEVKESTGAAVTTGDTEINVEGASTDYMSGAEAPPPELPTTTDPEDLVETNPWTSGSGSDPWQYRKTDKGYQAKKGDDGKEVDVTDPKSAAYQSIEKKIFKIESDYEEEIEKDYEEEFDATEEFQKIFKGAGKQKNKKRKTIHQKSIDISGVTGYHGKV